MSSDERSPVELLAEEFLSRHKRGEKPTIAEYCQRHPEWSVEIREVFEAVMMVEDLRPNSEDESGSFGSDIRLEGKRLEKVGDYRILREIGRGGMGVVYEAEQEGLGRRVALKVLPGTHAGDAKARARFEREAKAAARMHHTNIVPVFEVGTDSGHIFYAMQLIHGQGLDLVIDDLRRLRDKSMAAPAGATNGVRDRSLAASLMMGKFEQENLVAGADSDEVKQSETAAFENRPPSSAVLPGQADLSSAQNNRRAYYRSVAEIGLQTASALAYAHSRGIVHRDIKPSNLLLDAAGVVWVTDFGLAKTGDVGVTHTGDIVGTIRYMSPERFRGQCDGRSDVYALGLTLYEMLTLKPAFASPDRLKLIEQIRDTEPVSPRSLDGRLPRDLETIIIKAMDKDMRRRYQSSDEMAADLQRYVSDEPIHARRMSTAERFGRWCRRNPVVAALTAAVILITAMGFGATYMGMRAAQESADEADRERVKAVVLNVNLEKSQADVKSALRNATDLNISLEKSNVSLEKTTNALNASDYNRNVNAMQVAWEMGNVSMAREYLERLATKHVGQADLRGFEWNLFDRLCNSDVKRVPLEQPVTTPDAVLSADGSRLFSAETPVTFKETWEAAAQQRVTVKVVDSATGKTLRSLTLRPPTEKAKDGKGGFADGLVPISIQQQGSKKGGGFDPNNQFGGGGKGTSVAPIWTVNRNGTKLAYVAGGSGTKGLGGQGGGGSFPGGNILADQHFKTADKNSDGFLIEDEMSITLKAVWKKYDKNGDGKIDLEEHRAYWREFGPAQVGIDPSIGFNSLSADGKTLDLTHPRLGAIQAPLEKWAKDNKITTGVVTREEFAKFLETYDVDQPGGGWSGKEVALWNLNPFSLWNTDIYPAGGANLSAQFNRNYAAGAAAWMSLFALPQGAGPLVGTSRAYAGRAGDFGGSGKGKGVQLNPLPKSSPAHLRVLDVATGNTDITIPLGDDVVRNIYEQIAISPDGTKVAWHQGPGSEPLWIWTISGGKVISKVKIDHQVFNEKDRYILPWLRLAFSPDGTRLAVTSKIFKILAVWDTSTGKLKFSDELKGAATSPAFSPDGKQLAVLCMPALGQGAYEGAQAKPYIAQFDAITGERWEDISTSSMSVGVDISLNTGPQLRYSRDGKLIAVFNQQVYIGLAGGIPSSTTISIFNTETLELTRTLRGHQNAIVDVTAAASDQGFVSASMDGWIKEWDASGFDILRPTTIAGFEQFSKATVNSQYTKIALWNQTNPKGGFLGPKGFPATPIGVMDFKGQKFKTYTEHTGGIVEMALSPDGQVAASVGFLAKPGNKCELRVWDTSTGAKLFDKPVPTYELGKQKTAGINTKLAFRPDGKRLAVAARTGNIRYQVRVFDARTGVETGKSFEVEGTITALQFSSDGQSLVGTVAAKGLMVWNAATGELRWKYERTVTVEGGVNSTSIGFSADGTRMFGAFARPDVSVKGKLPRNSEAIVFDFTSGRKLLSVSDFNLPAGGINTTVVALSPDGKWLAVPSPQAGKGAAGTDIDIYDMDGNKKVEPLRGNQFVQQIAFSPDGRRLLVKDGDVVKVWDFTTRQSLLTLKVPGGDIMTPLGSFDFTPDGNRLVPLSRYRPLGGESGFFAVPAFSVLDATPLPERK